MSPYAPPLDAEVLRAIYPESDGKRMSDNMTQARWIFLFYGNLIALLADRPDAFVAADNLWYPVEGKPKVRVAPDVYVVFGRPKGDRGSYMQWLEDDIPLTVAVEILSPRNTKKEMAKKLRFYDRHGVEEYYVYDPDGNTLGIYTRDGGRLRRHRDIAKFVSPRLGIRFEMTAPEMTVFGPDGRPFIPFDELRRNADDNARLAARLRELSRKVRRGQAMPEEVAELDRLEGDPA
jgi:Uma2 family endonuclease